MNFSLIPATNNKHKYVAIFKQDGKQRRIPFGAKGYSDFLQHGDEDRKYRYLKRHFEREDWNNPFTAGTLSRFILWNKPTLDESVADYLDRFFT